MASTASKVGHGLAKVLGINLHYRNETGSERITRGESVFTIDSADTYVEDEPSAREWLHEVLPNGREMGEYLYSLFPFVHWIGRYNVQWLIGDLVAGMRSFTIRLTVADCDRYNCRRCCSTPVYGLRETRSASR
jgi:sodium-independent sulfate anion transporter 11